MKPFLYVQLDVYCPPHLFAKCLHDRNIPLQVVYGYYASIFKHINPINYQGIVVSGGFPGSYEEDKYPWLIPCKMFLYNAIKNNIPVFGICLGCQILANVCGGKVYRDVAGGEFGFYPCVFVNTNTNDPMINVIKKHDLFKSIPLIHGDTFDLPSKMVLDEGNSLDVVLLAQSKEKKQPNIFRIGKYHYGFQAHPEADAWLYKLLAKTNGNGMKFVEQAKNQDTEMKKSATLIFNNWIDMCLNLNGNSKSKL